MQQCYDVAGEWDYVVVLVTTGMGHCGEVADPLFMNDPNIRRYDTLPVFDRQDRAGDPDPGDVTRARWSPTCGISRGTKPMIAAALRYQVALRHRSRTGSGPAEAWGRPATGLLGEPHLYAPYTDANR